MRLLVTGSSGHLGDALMRMAAARGMAARGFDRVAAPQTDIQGDLSDAGLVAEAAQGCDAILHTATLHKPHVATHSAQDFIDTNITGTLNVLQAAVRAGVGAVVFTSTTSAFGAALRPPPGAPAVWIDAATLAVPKNIYGATKTAAEDLCHLFHRQHGVPVLVLRVSRFFPEPDDDPARRAVFSDTNLKANEFLHRRVDIEDAAEAHFRAAERAAQIGFERYVVSATTPFRPEDAAALRVDAAAVLARHIDFAAIYARASFRMAPHLSRVYDNARARRDLGWSPTYDFARILGQIADGAPIGSPLSRAVGAKGYHGDAYADGIYPV